MTRTDRIFAIVMTLAMAGAFVFAAAMAFDFWHGMPFDFDPAATVPLILGVLFSLIVGGAVVGVYFYGRRREIRDEDR
jgi:hypothetical protein